MSFFRFSLLLLLLLLLTTVEDGVFWPRAFQLRTFPIEFDSAVALAVPLKSFLLSSGGDVLYDVDGNDSMLGLL